MQVTTVSHTPTITQIRQGLGESARRSAEKQVPPAEFKPRAQVNTDVLAIGNGTGSEDLRAAQADWQRIQSTKAVNDQRAETELAAQQQETAMADDLRMIERAAGSGNVIEVLAAQQRLAKHVMQG
ncbi:hypothetical protein [Aestuariivirga litoralis]|uniref:hypothetical protein n=1 Tax=Aestuariivirga litoralis TaxID=2650924 RepID=UPI0018C7A501|nr:hypothetical protein [Aestuariivirga litoralis]MBG1233389.1 hypothetical protein [Aestuariivirga litoralis]